MKTLDKTDKKIIVPKHNGKRGHPILLSRIFKNEILTNFDDIGLRGILRAHDNDIYEMNVTDQSVIADMDYPQDYQKEIERYENRKEGDRRYGRRSRRGGLRCESLSARGHQTNGGRVSGRDCRHQRAGATCRSKSGGRRYGRQRRISGL